jgi:TonB-dependent SusC/RagA subfamily outer membrane receptor
MLSTLASTGVALAQSVITGTVVSSDDGEPVIGATVQVIGSSVGAVTDVDGHFSVTLPKGKTSLRVSYVGMDPVDVTAKNSMKVVLTPVTKGLDEVLVVAYGTAKKSAFTGAASVLDSKELTKTQVTKPIEAMKGKVAGVQMANSSGQPGSTSAIRIRGISSINAGNSPLIILDGTPYDGNINLINPQDIESQTILKDAASAALYGARGANGVILITTKNGRKDHTSITLDAKWGCHLPAGTRLQVYQRPGRIL